MPRFAHSHVFACLALLGVFGAASAADQPAKCRYGMVGKLPLQYHGASMSVTMAGEINRTPAVMLLDTGATDTYLTRLGTDKRSLRMDPSTTVVTGVGGMSRVFRAPIRHLQIGPIKSEQYDGSLMAIDQMGKRPDFDIIVGTDFLMETDLEISLAEKTVKFFSPKNCEKTFLGYWDPNAVVVPMLFERDRKRPMMEVLLNGVKMKALIDTGATMSVVTRSAAARAGVTPTSAGVSKAGQTGGIGSRIINLHNARFKTFAVGDETINNPVLMLMDVERPGYDLILGTDFLRAHRVLFAVSQNSVYLSYIGGAPFNDANNSTWIENEAKAGNGYGQFLMAMGGFRSGNEEGALAGREWLNKSVAGKNPLALHFLASEHASRGRTAESVAVYEQLIAIDSYDLTTQLELFEVRTMNGQADKAKAGLSAALAQFRWPRWPAPIAEYFLGKSTLDDLLRQARNESDLASRRECEVYRHARAYQSALGDAATAKTLAAKAKESCGGHADLDDEQES